MRVTFRDATPADAPAIAQVFRESFCDTFAHLYRAEDLATFLGQFTNQAWEAEIADPAFAVRVAKLDGEVAGFAKLGPGALPVDDAASAAELRQLYIAKARQGRGIARQLMDWALAEARRRHARHMLLTVYTDNHRARRFYRGYGFEEVGPYAFMVGEQADEDIIMRLAL